MYSGQHFSKRVAAKNLWRALVHEALPLVYEMYTVPVDIYVQAEYKKQPCDSDNLCDKILIDALKGYIIKDDDPNYVAWTSTRSFKSNRDHVTIMIVEANERL
jgi:hypothetical protein